MHTPPTQLQKAIQLHQTWKSGHLGGEVMPEDAKPDELPRTGDQTLAYFTLPMSLNYQRNSYKLWEAATATWKDSAAAWVFNPTQVAEAEPAELRSALLKHKVALQPNKHIKTWQTICQTLNKNYQGSLLSLLESTAFDIHQIKTLLQIQKRPNFPYLAGTKICNYWLYVLTQYTDYPFKNRQALGIAPDTHVLQSSLQLGVITHEEAQKPNAQTLLETRWQQLLNGTEFAPIDLHTPLWLWSRAGFPSL